MEPQFSPVRAAAYQPLVPLLAAFAAGITLDAGWRCGWLLGGGLAVLSAIGVLLALRLGGRSAATRTRASLRLGAIATLLATAATGAGWHHVAWRMFPADDLARRLDLLPRPVEIRIELRTQPRQRPLSPADPLASYTPRTEWDCEALITAVRERGVWSRCAGNARVVIVSESLNLHCGDRLRVLGLASRPTPAANPGEFDGADYEREGRRLTRLVIESREAIHVERRWRSWSGRRWLAELRQAGERRLKQHVPARHAGLASALLLGTREQLDQPLSESFFVTGLAHLLAISGLNVAIFAYGFWGVVRLGWLPRRVAYVGVAGLAVFYALLTGAEPPVVRAAILVVCMCGAKLLARQGLAFNTLAAAGWVVVAASPAVLFQTGAQLSFLAVAVLAREAAARPAAHLSDPLEDLLERSRSWGERAVRGAIRAVFGACVTSGRVWVLSVPLVAWRFHLVSPIALVINPLTLLPAAVALYAGFFVLVLAPVWPWAADVAGGICGAALSGIDLLVRWGQGVPGGHFWTPGPRFAWMLTFYAVAAATPLAGLPRRWCWRVAWVAVALLLTPAARVGSERLFFPAEREDEHWSSTFVAVGHGTSVLVEWPDGRTLLYDGGRLGLPRQGARAIASVLWSRGVSRIDALVISHADADHFNAIPELLERFQVQTLYVTPGMFRNPDGAVLVLRDAVRRRGLVCRELTQGDRIWSDSQGNVEVLHPPLNWEAKTDNASSLVLSIERGGRRLLLPGDLEGAGMQRLLEQVGGKWDVAMAPHHGGTREPSDRFLAWSRPDWVVVSGALSKWQSGTRRFDPSPAQLRHTALDGMVCCEFQRDGVDVRTHWRRSTPD
jgi:competence protein ComEC